MATQQLLFLIHAPQIDILHLAEIIYSKTDMIFSEAMIQEENKGFINDDDEDEDEGGSDSEVEGKRKRDDDDDDDLDADNLDEDDLDLIEENIGVKLDRKVRNCAHFVTHFSNVQKD